MYCYNSVFHKCMRSEGCTDIGPTNQDVGSWYELTALGWWVCWTCEVHMNRSHGESKGWFSDLKLIPVLELETKFNCHLPALKMCKTHEISTNYNHKKWTHRIWLDKDLWWVSELVQLWTLSWFSSEIYKLRHKVPTKIIFEMWNKRKY